jgi:polyferredoxin
MKLGLWEWNVELNDWHRDITKGRLAQKRMLKLERSRKRNGQKKKKRNKEKKESPLLCFFLFFSFFLVSVIQET